MFFRQRAERALLTFGVCAAAAACGDANDGAPGAGPGPGNRPPAFTSASSASTPENSTQTGYQATAADPDGDAVSFSIAGGEDAARFSIGANSGLLSFVSAPDFEAPADADADNIYRATLRAADGVASAALDVEIQVLDKISEFRVRRVATQFDAPVALAATRDGSGRLYVVERAGEVELFDPATGTINSAPFFSDPASITINGDDGLLGFTLAPDFEQSGEFYIFATGVDSASEIRRYRVRANDPERADLASREDILRFTRPTPFHIGGWLDFGADGFLYASTGDGGPQGDPFNFAQDLTSLLGKILRIDPGSDGFPNDPDRNFSIPSGNPALGGLPEIWAFGLRNPFKAHFDTETGDLYIADVGQDTIEELDLAPAGVGGLNFGWNVLEGTAAFTGAPGPQFTPPVLQYFHGDGPFEGNSITGGIIYRGPIEEFRNRYFYADAISSNIWSVAIEDIAFGETLSASSIRRHTDEFAPDAGTLDLIVGFGADENGDMYIVGIDGEIFKVEAE